MAYLFGQFIELIKGTARLAHLATHIDLYADIKWRQPGGTLVVETLGDFESLNTMNPGEVLGNWSGFIGLNWTDEVPFEGKIAKLSYLLQRLL